MHSFNNNRPTNTASLSVRAIIETFASEQGTKTLSGSPDGFNRTVHSAGIISSAEDISKQRPNSLVIIPPHVATSVDVNLELMIRRAAAVRISCMVIDAGPSTLPISSAQLAEQFGIVLWREKNLDPVKLLSRIENLVRNPELVGADTIRVLSEKLTVPSSGFAEIVEKLSTELGHPASLIGPDASTIVGTVLIAPEPLAPLLQKASTNTKDLVLDSVTAGRRLLVVPAFPLVPNPPPFWLVVEVPRGLDSRSSHVFTSMRIASLSISTSFLLESLDYEKDNRQAESLLEKIIEDPTALEISEIERAAVMGWQLFGWHSVIIINAERFFADLPISSLTQTLVSALQNQGIDARPVRRGNTLLFWVTRSAPATEQEDERLVEDIKLSFEDMRVSFPGIKLRAGIGESREGADGISHSLEGARLALALAEANTTENTVQLSAEMTANRLLDSWLPTGSARDAMLSIIDSLTSVAKDGHLLETLQVYLDSESNTSETANRMHVHRNTVIQRITKIRELLPLNLDDPGDRLAVQVALKLHSNDSSIRKTAPLTSP